MFKYDKFFTLMKEYEITTYKVRKEKIVSETALSKMRNNDGNLDTRTLDRIFNWFYDNMGIRLQPNDIMEWLPDNSNCTSDEHKEKMSPEEFINYQNERSENDRKTIIKASLQANTVTVKKTNISKEEHPLNPKYVHTN